MTHFKHIRYSLFAAVLLLGCTSGTKNNDNNKTDPDPQRQKTEIRFDTNTSVNIDEGNTEVLTIKTNKTDLSFTIVAGEDSDKFEIDSQNATLSFRSAPDFENPTDQNKDNRYIVTVEAKSEDQSARVTFTITVKDDISDNGPDFTSPDNIKIVENTLLDFTVTAANAVSYSIQGGDDKDRFTIDSASGKLGFLNFIPDFEHSSDKNHDNIYEITVKATDSSQYGSLQDINITVEDDPDDTPDPDQQRHVFKTGADDGITAGNPFGDDRVYQTESVNDDKKVTLGTRVWEDSPHVKEKLTYNDALQYCNTLEYAGIDNWRIPKRHELFEIINYGKNPTIDDAFENITGGYYWTSQPLINYKGETIDDRAFVVSFTYGAPYPSKMDTTNYVRCVSGPEYTDITPLIESAEKIFKDETTGLEWAKAADNQTWADAKKRCEDLNISGKNDWRLPNINELYSIMPVYNEEFLLDKDGDGYGDLRGPFWSSTPAATNPAKARYIANYWDGDTWAADDENLTDQHPVYGRDVLNEDEEPKTSGDVSGSICVRGGHL